MAQIQKRDNTECWQGMKHQAGPFISDQNARWQNHFGGQFGTFLQYKHILNIRSRNHNSCYVLKGIEDLYPHKICTWALNDVGGTRGPQITKKTRNVKHRGFFSMEEIKYLFSLPEGWEWILLRTWRPFWYPWRQDSPTFCYRGRLHPNSPERWS